MYKYLVLNNKLLLISIYSFDVNQLKIMDDAGSNYFFNK